LIRCYLIGGLLTCSLLANGQDYQFKQPKNCRIEITLLDSYFENPQIIGDTIEISYYDESGNKIKSIRIFEELIASSTSFKYDNLGNLVESLDYGVLIDSLPDKIYYNNNLDDWLIIRTTNYKYENGLLKQTNTYSRKNKLESSILYDYDSQKRLIKELNISYPDKTSLIYHNLNEYEIDWNNPERAKLKTYTTTYEYLNNIRISTYSDSSGLISSDTSTINDDLVERTITYDSKGKFLCENNFKYINKQLIEYSVIGCEMDILIPANRFVYEYDKDGVVTSEYYYDKEKLLQKVYYIRIK
jgi:hypothetical protein